MYVKYCANDFGEDVAKKKNVDLLTDLTFG